METKTSILIVDDDPGMTKSIEDILRYKGFDVTTASDGYRAIEMVKERTYDVALMDIKMPGINGVETFIEVKHISPSTKVIMMTAYAVDDLIKTAMDEGAYAIFHKPLDLDSLLETIGAIGKGALVMVVDDDPLICETIKDVLNEKDFRVSVAHSGKEAIRFAEENNLDIVLIDVKMPVLNGLETYREVKKANKGITAVMMTGYRQDTAELVKDAVKSSAYTCLYKPFQMDDLLAVLDAIIEQKKEGKLIKPGMEDE